MADNRYCVEYAKRGTAACKKCKEKIEKGLVRIGKIVPNPFTDGQGEMKMWYHVPCMFEQLSRARATTKKIESPDDLEGWEDVQPEDRREILNYMSSLPSGSAGSAKKTKQPSSSPKRSSSPAKIKGPSPSRQQPGGKDDSFREFRRLCAEVAEESSYNGKTKIIEEFFRNGTSGKGFRGDVYLWVKMLCPNVSKRIYNLQSKQLVKLFSQIFGTSHEEMLADLEEGDVAETVRIFFEQSERCVPVNKSTLTLQQVDSLLEELSSETKEEGQIRVLQKIAKKCTANDLKMVVRLIKHDLRINAGVKHVLEALHPDAYQAFQASRDLRDVVERCLSPSGKRSDSLAIQASLMTPVLPMLAEPCRSVDYAFKKCPNGFFAEIKYDGERVQVHKQGNAFKYYSRSLKPVVEHKVAHLKEFIPRAFPHGNDLILDSEILLVDTKTGKPLPFGTLGVHKKAAFKDASVCLFVFDCIHYNGESLMDRPLQERRKILHKNMKEIPNHIMFSEMRRIKTKEELRDMIVSVIRQGLEGLVLKDVKSVYEPGKRHWLKVKKDYLDKGSMADSADLVVLGAYFGTGNKGGMMSIFLMGCYDTYSKKWCTVTKVHGGHDDATLQRLQTELDMIKIKKDVSKVPSWLKVNKSLVPDFVSQDPKKAPVWEITGAEFTRAEVHTADGISIRFPRVTCIRTDKDWRSATTLQELQELYRKSKETWDLPEEAQGDDVHFENGSDAGDSDEDVATTSSPRRQPRKRKDSPKRGIKQEEPSPKKAKPTIEIKQSPAHSTDQNNSPSSHQCIFPSTFKGVRVILPETVEKYDLLRRYVIAYDGDIVDPSDTDSATHVVIEDKTTKKKEFNDINQVTADWLWDSIKLQRLRPCGPYSPEN